MSAESDLVRVLAARAAVLNAGLDEALALLGDVPADPVEFSSLSVVRRVAATALIKRLEQTEDVTMRLFRAILRVDGVDTSEWTNRDLANRMEKRGMVPDSADWMAMVRLRNRLAHEYPAAPGEQLARLNEVVVAVPRLKAIVRGTLALMETER